MDNKFVNLLSFLVVCILLLTNFANCQEDVKIKVPEQEVQNLQQNADVGVANVVEFLENFSREGRSNKMSAYVELTSCALAFNARCFVDAAGDMLAQKRNDLLAQADLEAVSGRADSESKPSEVSSLIDRLIAELTGMFKDGVAGLFKTAKEGENDEIEDDAEEEEEENETEDQKDKQRSARKLATKNHGVARKKKKGKLKALIKLIILGVVVVTKIKLLLKILAAHLQIKFLLIAFAGLILNAARFYLDLKKGHQPQKVIYYEHAQHQHHYEGGDEDWSSSPEGGSYWGRSYDEEEASKDGTKTAQDYAYAKSKPSYAYKVADKPSSNSWFS